MKRDIVRYDISYGNFMHFSCRQMDRAYDSRDGGLLNFINLKYSKLCSEFNFYPYHDQAVETHKLLY